MTKKEIAARLDAFLGKLDPLGLDGVVLDKRDDHYYYTGYTGSDSLVVLSVKSRKGWLVTDSRYTEEAEKTAPGMEVVAWTKNFPAFVGELLKKNRCKKIGFTPSSLTAAFFTGMKDAATGAKEWKPVEPIIAEQRSIKSRAEIEAMRVALSCSEAAFLASKKHWKPGMTEIEVKNDLEWEMRKHGADDTSFETIVAVGANASLPHAHAGKRPIKTGKMLLIDFGVRINRYCSDLTRTLWAGEVPAVWRKRYEAVLAAQTAGREAIAAGVEAKVPYLRARESFRRTGLDKYFTHSLGHSLGLAVHEDPRLGGASAHTLRAGNIVTIEPGVYFPGSGGIRVEDMVAVEESCARVLSTLPRDLASMVF